MFTNCIFYLIRLSLKLYNGILLIMSILSVTHFSYQTPYALNLTTSVPYFKYLYAIVIQFLPQIYSYPIS